MTEARIGVCGGTFDPFHRGHLEPLRDIFEEMGWTQVRYVPANVQPFKKDRHSVSAYHRFAMIALAIEGDPRFLVDPIELERGGVSYTVDTLESLTMHGGGAAIDLIVGDDNLPMLPAWRSLERILELANIVVLGRENGAALPSDLTSRIVPAGQRGSAGSISFAPNARVHTSATEVRRAVETGLEIEVFVGARVAQYIQQYGLYRGTE